MIWKRHEQWNIPGNNNDNNSNNNIFITQALCCVTVCDCVWLCVSEVGRRPVNLSEIKRGFFFFPDFDVIVRACSSILKPVKSTQKMSTTTCRLVGRQFFSPSKDVHTRQTTRTMAAERKEYLRRGQRASSQQLTFFFFILFYFFPDSIAAAIIIM